MPLCSNRPEGFGPLSTHYTHILTSCFIDTILLPLCTWLYLLALLLLFDVFSVRQHPPFKQSPHRTPAPAPEKAPTHDHEPATALAPVAPPPHTRTPTRTALLLLYTLLILAQLGLCILECTRLVRAHLGPGLLPFTCLALPLAALLHLLSSRMRRSQRTLTWLTGRRVVGRTGRVRRVRWLNLALWMALLAGCVVKLVGEAKEGAGTRGGRGYSVGEQMVGGGVMVGLYVAIAVLEVVT